MFLLLRRFISDSLKSLPTVPTIETFEKFEAEIEK